MVQKSAHAQSNFCFFSPPMQWDYSSQLQWRMIGYTSHELSARRRGAVAGSTMTRRIIHGGMPLPQPRRSTPRPACVAAVAARLSHAMSRLFHGITTLPYQPRRLTSSDRRRSASSRVFVPPACDVVAASLTSRRPSTAAAVPASVSVTTSSRWITLKTTVNDIPSTLATALRCFVQNAEEEMRWWSVDRQPQLTYSGITTGERVYNGLQRRTARTQARASDAPLTQTVPFRAGITVDFRRQTTVYVLHNLYTVPQKRHPIFSRITQSKMNPFDTQPYVHDPRSSRGTSSMHLKNRDWPLMSH